jgi:hypothetical protein
MQPQDKPLPGYDASHLFRRSGRSTRIVDKLVQDFFKEGVAHGYDHHVTSDAANNAMLCKESINRVARRLVYEHRLEAKRDFYFDAERLTIYNRNFKK